MNQNELYHFGVKGMRWGVRRTPAQLGHDISAKHKAKKDAKEFARAKMYYGEGAGTRRKLIKAKVAERSKDPKYKEEFDKALGKQDMAKHADKARIERHARDAAGAVAKTGRGFIHLTMGDGARVATSAVAAYSLYRFAKATGADKVMADKVRSAYNSVKSGAARRKAYQAGADALRRMGMDVKW